MGAPYQKTLTLSLIAAVANGVALSQAGTAATPLTINGSLATSSVATFDTARRVGITSAGNDTTNTFTIVGTDYYGRPQTEVLAGASGGTAQTLRDFLTVSSVTPTNNTAANVTVGTTTVGSTPPVVLDCLANPFLVSVANIITGTVNYNIEETFDDFSPAWNVNIATPTWFQTGMIDEIANSTGSLNAPATMIRLTINSGTGSVITRIIQSALLGVA